MYVGLNVPCFLHLTDIHFQCPAWALYRVLHWRVSTASSFSSQVPFWPQRSLRAGKAACLGIGRLFMFMLSSYEIWVKRQLSIWPWVSLGGDEWKAVGSWHCSELMCIVDVSKVMSMAGLQCLRLVEMAKPSLYAKKRIGLYLNPVHIC